MIEDKTISSSSNNVEITDSQSASCNNNEPQLNSHLPVTTNEIIVSIENETKNQEINETDLLLSSVIDNVPVIVQEDNDENNLTPTENEPTIVSKTNSQTDENEHNDSEIENKIPNNKKLKSKAIKSFIFDLSKLLLKIFAYYTDMILDIELIIDYFNSNHMWYFGLTLFFIVIPRIFWFVYFWEILWKPVKMLVNKHIVEKFKSKILKTIALYFAYPIIFILTFILPIEILIL